jgi:hypothetical protein
MTCSFRPSLNVSKHAVHRSTTLPAQDKPTHSAHTTQHWRTHHEMLQPVYREVLCAMSISTSCVGHACQESRAMQSELGIGSHRVRRSSTRMIISVAMSTAWVRYGHSTGNGSQSARRLPARLAQHLAVASTAGRALNLAVLPEL